MCSRVWQTRVGRLVFVGVDNVFFGIDTFLYDCLDRVTDKIFLAYSVLAKPECAFVPDVRLVLANCGTDRTRRLELHRLWY